MADFETVDFSDGSDFEEFLGFEDVDEAEYFDEEYEPIDRELWLRHMFVNDDEEEEDDLGGGFEGFQTNWKTDNYHRNRRSAFNRTPGVKLRDA